MKTGWRIEAPQIALIALMFAVAAFAWPAAPDRIPVHWNAAGEIDRYGGKFEGLLLLPIIASGLYLLLRFMPSIDPGRANYARFGGAYAAIRFAVLGLMAAIQGVVVYSVLGHPVNMALTMPVLIGILFIVMGALMGKIRPNWFVGIRTPWTLTSKTAWVRTHRLGGWLFIAQGLLFFVSGMLGYPILNVGVVVSMLAMVGVLFVYSYVVWRADPEKESPAGTQPADEE